MTTQLFGTDGIRGKFGRHPMDEDTLRRLGAALAVHLAPAAQASAAGRRPALVLGGDTRFSTSQICRWLASELEARGFELVYLGVMTTPGIAAVVAAGEALCGLAVSASHNPAADNGVKLIGADGFKWPSAEEARLEDLMAGSSLEVAGGEVVLEVDSSAAASYLQSLVESMGGDRLDRLKIAIDAGHGAASPYARRLFEGLGAEVVVTGDDPDGHNINLDRGSTQPRIVADLVRRHECDLGLAFDGDADRVILADEKGEIRDGDNILYLWSRHLHRNGHLPGDAVVATSMSNLGLEVALRHAGIELVRCDVGDRAVVETLKQRGLVLGGEQSGHIVHLDLATTGDGLLTAIQACRIVGATGRPLSGLLQDFTRYPQVLRGLEVRHKPPLEGLPEVQQAAARVRSELGADGRLVLRYSGTERLVRTMIEGPDLELIESLADRLESVLAEVLA